MELVAELKTGADGIEKYGQGCIGQLVSAGGRWLAHVGDLVDEVREHCVVGVDALLSDLADDLIEGTQRVWAGSVYEACEVAIASTLEDVLVDNMWVCLSA